MHSYLLSAPALFICVCESGCSPVCMVRQCVYLFMSSVWVLSLHHPTVQQKLSWLSKQEWNCGEAEKKKKKKKKKLSSSEIYLFLLLASLKLLVGDFKMAAPHATEWALPCQNVFEWKTQTAKFPPFFLSPRCFSLLPLRLPHPFLSILHHSSKGHLILTREAFIDCCLYSEKNCLFLCLSLFRWSPARALCLSEVRYLPVTQRPFPFFFHKNMMSISRVLSGKPHRSWHLCQERLWSVQPTKSQTNGPLEKVNRGVLWWENRFILF